MKIVFISYSRRDQVFARRVFERLEGEQINSWADWEGIPYSAEWWEEIKKGIEAAENFVCILSPAYISSEFCNKELAYARSLNKRVIPVVRRELRDRGQFLPDIRAALYGQPWAALAEENDREVGKLNYLFCRKKKGYDCQYDEVTRKVTNPECDGADSDAEDFETAFLALFETTRKNSHYIEQHTHLLTLALAWESGNRSRLLRGDDLTVAEAWLAGNQGKDPPPSDLHHRFITESRKALTRRRTLLATAGAVAITILTVLTVISLLLARIAEQRADDLRSFALVVSARERYAAGDTFTALPLALAANSISNPSLIAKLTLAEIIESTNSQMGADSPVPPIYLGRQHVFSIPRGIVTDVVLSPNGQSVFAGSTSNTMTLWVSAHRTRTVQCSRTGATSRCVFECGVQPGREHHCRRIMRTTAKSMAVRSRIT